MPRGTFRGLWGGTIATTSISKELPESLGGRYGDLYCPALGDLSFFTMPGVSFLVNTNLLVGSGIYFDSSYF